MALIGPSGCGKSSVVKLLARFYDHKAGSITLDGEPLENYNVHSLRNKVAIVSQEPVLFARSIRENIMMGAIDGKKNFGCEQCGLISVLLGVTPSQEDMEEAARQANCHDFILGLPQGYDTIVGEKGATLSGGQVRPKNERKKLALQLTVLCVETTCCYCSCVDSQTSAVVAG